MAAAASKQQQACVLVFSFGSNSLAQLSARVAAAELSGWPATVDGYRRTFARHSVNWRAHADSALAAARAWAVLGLTLRVKSGDRIGLKVFKIFRRVTGCFSNLMCEQAWFDAS